MYNYYQGCIDALVVMLVQKHPYYYSSGGLVTDPMLDAHILGYLQVFWCSIRLQYLCISIHCG